MWLRPRPVRDAWGETFTFVDNECYPRDAGVCRFRGDTGDKWYACVVVLFTVSGCSERRCATSALVQPSATSESASSSRGDNRVAVGGESADLARVVGPQARPAGYAARVRPSRHRRGAPNPEVAPVMTIVLILYRPSVQPNNGFRDLASDTPTSRSRVALPP
jgi:hypothetical protein